MPAPTRADRGAAFLRCFAIQGSWNYRTLIGCGLAYAMLPLLTRVHAGNPVALRDSLLRHAAPFNAHPYLSAMAVGALSRLEHERVEVGTIERFRTALRAPLGALGDRAVWAGWRPFCLLGAVVAFGVGLDAWKAVLLFLATYNAGHLWLRAWAFRRGWEAGLDVGPVLSRSLLEPAGRWLARASQVLLGVAAGWLVLRLPGPSGIDPVLGIGAVAVAVTAYFFPSRSGMAGVVALVGAAAAWFV